MKDTTEKQQYEHGWLKYKGRAYEAGSIHLIATGRKIVTRQDKTRQKCHGTGDI
jgi:hypothetical protein